MQNNLFVSILLQFVQAELTLEQLVAELKAKGADVLEYSSENNTATVKFMFENKLYEFTSVTDTGIEQPAADASAMYGPEIGGDEGITPPADGTEATYHPSASGTPNVAQTFDDPDYNSRYQQYVQKGAKQFVLAYFDFDPPTLNKIWNLTTEQIKFVNEHPEIFHMTIDEDKLHGGYFDAFTFDKYITGEEIEPNDPESKYTYAAGTYDMFGNGNPQGPDGSIPVGIDGVYVKPEAHGEENGFSLYLYDSSTREYTKTWHRYDATMGSVITALKYGQMQWANPMMFDADEIVDLKSTITLYGHDGKERELYSSLLFGYNQTDKDGIYEKDGKYYQFSGDSKDFMDGINESKIFTEISADEIEGEITVYKNNSPKTEDYSALAEQIRNAINNPDYPSELYPLLCVDSCDGQNVVLGEKFKKAVFDYLHHIFNMINEEIANSGDKDLNAYKLFQKYCDQDPLLNALFGGEYNNTHEFQQICDTTNGKGGGHTHYALRNELFNVFVSGAVSPDDAYEVNTSGEPWTISLDHYIYVLINLGLVPDELTGNSGENSVQSQIEADVEADKALQELFSTEVDLVNNPPKLVTTIEELDALAEQMGMQKDEQGFYWKSGHAGETGALCFTWNPITQKFEKVEVAIDGYTGLADYIGTPTKYPGKWQQQMMSMAAVRQNLNFTSDPRVCIDNENNFWVYDSTTGAFVKQDGISGGTASPTLEITEPKDEIESGGTGGAGDSPVSGNKPSINIITRDPKDGVLKPGILNDLELNQDIASEQTVSPKFMELFGDDGFDMDSSGDVDDAEGNSGVTGTDGTSTGNRTASDDDPTYTDDTIGNLLSEWVRKYVGSLESTISRKVISILYRMCQDGLQLKHDTEIPNTQWDSNNPDAELLGNLLNAYSYTGNSSYSDYSTQFCMRLMQILSNGVELNTVYKNDGSYYYTNSTEYYENISNNMAKILDAIGATKGEYNLYTNIDFEKFMKYILDATEPPYNSIAFGSGVYSSLSAEINDITNKGIDSVPYDSSLSKMFSQSGLSLGALPYYYRVHLSGTSIYDNIDYFPNTTGQHITLEDFYSTQALCYIPNLHYMTENGEIYKGYALYNNLYDGTPLSSRPNPPFFRVAIDNNNCIYASDDVAKCVQKYIKELIAKGLSCSADKYCQMFGFTENDVNDLELIKQKINNTYKQLGGELGSDGNYHLSWTKYYEKLSNMDITVFDKVNAYVEGSPTLKLIPRNEAEANIVRMNYWIDSCNAVVDYGFTLADIYGLSSKASRNLDEFGNVVYTKTFIKDLINGEYDSEDNPNLIYTKNEALIKALKNAASKMDGVDNLINTWFKNSDRISPEEILAWLTGVHPDGSGECYVEQKHYTPEEVNTMCKYSSEYWYPDTSAGNNNIEEFFKPVYDNNGNILYYVMRPGKITAVFNCMETIPFNLEYSQEQQDKLDTLSPILAELGITGELPRVDVDNFVYSQEPKNEYSVQEMYAFASSYAGQECIDNMLTINPDGSAVVHLQDYVQYYKPYPGFDIQISPEEMALIINDAVKNGSSVQNIKLEIINYAYKKFIQEVAERVVSYLDKYQEENGNLDIFPNRWYQITILDDYNGDFFGATIEDYDNALRNYDHVNRASELRLGDLLQFKYDIDWQKLIKQYKENPDFDFVQAVLDTFEQPDMEYYMTQLILSSSGKTDLLDNYFPSSEYSCRVFSEEPFEEKMSEAVDNLILLGNAGVEFYGSFSFGHHTGLDGYTCNECTIVNVVGNKVYYTISTENNETVHTITVDELKRKARGLKYTVLELDASIDEKIASYKATNTSEIISEETNYANIMAAKYPPLEDNDEKKYAAIGRMKLTLVTRNPVAQFGEAYRDKHGRYYVWSPYKGEMVFVADYSGYEESKIITGLYGKLKDMEEYQASKFIPTTTPGVYYNPETGAYYKYTGCNGTTSVTINGQPYNQPFIELTDNDTQNWTYSHGYIYVETSSPGVYTHNGELYANGIQVDSFALGRAIASMDLYESPCQNVYIDRAHHNYYIWNPTTETMEKMEGITAINERGTQAKGTKYYAYIKAAREGFIPSKTEGVFIKFGRKFVYDAQKDKFVRA